MPIKIKIKRSRTVQVSETSISDHSSPPSAAEVAANDDLLTEILLRLPIRPLLRFKSVSKHWLSLITNPYFSILRNPNPNPPSGLLFPLYSHFVNPEFDFIPLNDDHNAAKPPFRTLNFVNVRSSGITILQSSNGLLCCCSYQSAERRHEYYIYNPTTKQFTTLPRLQGGGASMTIYSMCLAFDPSKSPNYKVVCVRGSELGPPDHYQIEIYSSQTGPWRVSGKPFTSNFIAQFGKGVYWNGSIHWFSCSENLLYFNVHQERLEKMPMPWDGEDREDWEFPYFGESGDCLHLVETPTLRMTQFTIYEMKRDYSKWSVKYNVDLNGLHMAFPQVIRGYTEPPDLYYYAIHVLLVVRGEKDGDSFLVLRSLGKALRYNFEDKSIKKIYDFDPVDADNEFPDEESEELNGCSIAFPYIESLACV